MLSHSACGRTDRAEPSQELQGVTFAAFKLRVDILNVMRFNKTVIDNLLNSTALHKRVVSVILFRHDHSHDFAINTYEYMDTQLP